MKKSLGILSVSACLLLSSCATIIGGSSYYAKVVVNNNPKAKTRALRQGRTLLKVKNRSDNRLESAQCDGRVGRKFNGLTLNLF